MFIAPEPLITLDWIERKQQSRDWFGKGDYEMTRPSDSFLEEMQSRFIEDSIVKTEPIQGYRDHPYAPLMKILLRAHGQAANGKGKERHSNGLDFMNQPIITDGRNLPDGLVFQARKKLLEASKCVDTGRAVTDLLGAIVYTAAYIIVREEGK